MIPKYDYITYKDGPEHQTVMALAPQPEPVWLDVSGNYDLYVLKAKQYIHTNYVLPTGGLWTATTKH